MYNYMYMYNLCINFQQMKAEQKCKWILHKQVKNTVQIQMCITDLKYEIVPDKISKYLHNVTNMRN